MLTKGSFGFKLILNAMSVIYPSMFFYTYFVITFTHMKNLCNDKTYLIVFFFSNLLSFYIICVYCKLILDGKKNRIHRKYRDLDKLLEENERFIQLETRLSVPFEEKMINSEESTDVSQQFNDILKKYDLSYEIKNDSDYKETVDMVIKTSEQPKEDVVSKTSSSHSDLMILTDHSEFSTGTETVASNIDLNLSETTAQTESNTIKSENNRVKSETIAQTENNRVKSENNRVKSESNTVQSENKTVQQDKSAQTEDITVKSENNRVKSESNTVQSENKTVQQDKSAQTEDITVKSENNRVKSESNIIQQDTTAQTENNTVKSENNIIQKDKTQFLKNQSNLEQPSKTDTNIPMTTEFHNHPIVKYTEQQQSNQQNNVIFNEAFLEQTLQVQDKKVKVCKNCDVLKPPRAHHCSICNVCYFKMDHHCTFLNICIGLKNYKTFLLFLGSNTIFSFGKLIIFFFEIFHGNNTLSPIYYIIGIILSFLLLFICGSLFIFHLKLTGNNETSIEYFAIQNVAMGDYFEDKGFQEGPLAQEWIPEIQRIKNLHDNKYFRKWINPYNIELRNNFLQVFGSNWYVWLIPFYTGTVDGYYFPKNGLYSRGS
ncbi:putative DHHC-type Zn-finger protein [Pseudoloma neurophilia]|uniref:Palmitoyltransferase n=1 Tax=Pseudoloma neurophilia TaxID=146866 RepID=A0A0R0MAI6_9MICR|nr:putative DHHC-type Zn-finger protein [Pseudoloma neurophilia]